MLLALLLVACVTSLDFDTRAAGAACDRLQECDAAAFEGAFADVAECREELAGVGNCYERHCTTFVLDEAIVCLEAVRDTPCGSPVNLTSDACGGVWDECDSLELAACLVQESLGALFE